MTEECEATNPLLTNSRFILLGTVISSSTDNTSDNNSLSEQDKKRNANDEAWNKDFELDDYYSLDNKASTENNPKPFGDSMKVIAEVFGEILAQLSMTTATEDPSCDLLEDYQIVYLLKATVLDFSPDSKLLPFVTKSARNFLQFFAGMVVAAQQVSGGERRERRERSERRATTQHRTSTTNFNNFQYSPLRQIPSHVMYYKDAPVVGPTPEVSSMKGDHTNRITTKLTLFHSIQLRLEFPRRQHLAGQCK